MKPSTPKANFFLVGAPKAGTTSVDRLLRRHPQVFLSPIKEPGHFCPDVAEQLAPSFGKKTRLDIAAFLDSPDRPTVGLAWVTAFEHYQRLFEGAAKSYADLRTEASQAGARPEAFDLGGSANLMITTAREDVVSDNVIGLIPGSDPALKDEYVVLTAHLDTPSWVETALSARPCSNNATAAARCASVNELRLSTE